MNNYDAIEIDFTADGNTSLRAGEMVKLNLPSNAVSKQIRENKTDRFYRGSFLVRNIMHKFARDDWGNKHIMDMSCVADCVDEPIPATDKNLVPEVFGKTNKKVPLKFNIA